MSHRCEGQQQHGSSNHHRPTHVGCDTLRERCENGRNEVWKDLKPVLNDRRAAMERGEMADVDDCLTAMIRDDMEDKDVIDHVTTLICAGHDTTAFFTAYLFLCLAQNPDCQEQLRAEVLRVVGDKDVTAESVAEMKYLQKVTR